MWENFEILFKTHDDSSKMIKNYQIMRKEMSRRKDIATSNNKLVSE